MVIFHYHLFPGGVTNVVTLSIRAILDHLPQIERIRLVCGSERHLQTLRHNVFGRGSEVEKHIELDVVPELFYLRRNAEPGDADVPDTAVLKEILQTRYAGAYWWIHNYHLGKNPVFTQALLEIARERPDQPLLFHIHDFPECARYDNLALLKRFVHLPLYPTTDNVRYVVINSRDLKLLRDAGVPEKSLFLLNNPVRKDQPRAPDRPEIRAKLERNFADRFPAYRRGAPLLFYPVRAIRRKNALEAGLFTRIAVEPANLIITLPGVSEKEAPYSALVQTCYERGLIPGMSGIGTALGEAGIGFQELALSTDCVVSSSVQEGFGYLFIDGRRWLKPVFGRYLDILEGIEDIVDGEGAYFYREFKVPIASSMRKKLLHAYRSRVTAISLHLPPSAHDSLFAEIDRSFRDRAVDFSYLSVSDQLSVLEKAARDSGVREDIAGLNRVHLDALSRLMNGHTRDIGERIQRHFSLETFAAELGRILESFSAPRRNRAPDATKETEGGPEAGDRIHRNLRSAFASLGYIRLLYE